MTARLQVAMMSVAGREEITADTCASLMGRGGLAELGVVPVLHYQSIPGRPSPTAPGWVITSRELAENLAEVPRRFRDKRRRSPWLDFAHVLEMFEPGVPALFFEDDLVACTNAVKRMATLEVPADVGLVSFFDFRNEWTRPGLWRNPTDREFHGAQALLIPAPVVARLQELALQPTALRCWDVWLGRAVAELGLKVAHYAPSLVEHVGMYSMYAPGTERPMANNFPGEDFDALGPCADPIQPGPKPKVKDVFCEMHREYHPGGVTCGVSAV